jgi:hypothetical protein
MRILRAMLSELLEFLFIWSMVVLCFSMNALLLFGEMKEFTTLTQSLIQVLNASLGSYDTVQFENHQNLRV